jgi:hypothetical protein
MYMLFIRDILLVEVINVDFLLSMRRSQKLQEVALELARVIRDVFLGVFTNQQHLADMRFGLRMAFEAIFISHLSFTGL